MPKDYSLSDEKKETFAGLFLLEALVNSGLKVPVLFEGDDKFLEPLVAKLFQKEWVAIDKDRYVPTSNGRDKLKLFMQRYSEFLNTLDVFHSVDLARGEFAMAKYFELDDNAWTVYLAEDRWEDLRVAVAEFKKIDPVEIVFMSFLNEGRFDATKPGWQFDLTLGTIWNELLAVCKTALQAEDLGYDDPSGSPVTGEAVLKDVITKGTDVLLELFKIEKEQGGGGGTPSGGTVETYEVAEPVTMVYYEPYYDPYYSSPYWRFSYW